jgi:hypothetical protein
MLSTGTPASLPAHGLYGQHKRPVVCRGIESASRSRLRAPPPPGLARRRRGAARTQQACETPSLATWGLPTQGWDRRLDKNRMQWAAPLSHARCPAARLGGRRPAARRSVGACACSKAPLTNRPHPAIKKVLRPKQTSYRSLSVRCTLLLHTRLPVDRASRRGALPLSPYPPCDPPTLQPTQDRTASAHSGELNSYTMQQQGKPNKLLWQRAKR